MSYDQVKIKPNSIIYCDPPYLGTAKYDEIFDHRVFLNWCADQKVPVFISEYRIVDERFRLVFKIKKRSLLGGHKQQKIEKVYANPAGAALLAKVISKQSDKPVTQAKVQANGKPKSQAATEA